MNHSFELEAAQAQKILDTHDLGRLVSLVRIPEGMINPTYCLNASWILRVNVAHPDLAKFEKEQSLYQRLRRESSVPVPDVIAVDSSRKAIPFTYILMHKLDGCDLKKKWNDLTDYERNNVAHTLGDHLAQIHSIEFPQFGHDFSDGTFTGSPTWDRYVLDYNEELARRASKTLPSEEIDRLQRVYVKHQGLLADARRPSLVHQNFTFTNVRTHRGTVNGIFDFEWAFAGHDEYEVAVVKQRAIPKDQIRDFMDGYLSRRSLSPDFAQREVLYCLWYYFRALPDVPTWTHKREVQRNYISSTLDLLDQAERM